MNHDEFVARNRVAWNGYDDANRWTVPVDEAEVARAREGDFCVLLTETRPVPRDWFPRLKGLALLGLASGGGHRRIRDHRVL